MTRETGALGQHECGPVALQSECLIYRDLKPTCFKRATMRCQETVFPCGYITVCLSRRMPKVF